MRPGAIREWLATEPVFREAASFVSRQEAEVYLVGGTVRDLLVGRAGYDMDLAVVGDAMGLARRLADAVGGAYVAMDPERDVARVVVRRAPRGVGVPSAAGEPGTAEARIIDLAGLRAGSIHDDLRARDFTVNAMAVSLNSPERGLLDPTGGRDDLDARVLRVTHPGAFEDDPLRILRGVRLRQALGWRIDPETERLMRDGAFALVRVSPERVRDELAQIMAIDGAADGLAHAHGLAVLAPAIPGSDGAGLSAGIAAVAGLERVESFWRPGGRAEGVARSLRAPLDHLRAPVQAYWQEELSGGRTRCVALRLAALLWARDDVAAAAGGLHLSAREVRLVAGAVEAARALLGRHVDRPPSRLDIYRYFRGAGEAGVAGAVLALAVNEGSEGLPEYVVALLQAWFEERRHVIDPIPLLHGGDVMAALGLTPGPRVGEALEALREAQVQGLVTTPEEAREYLRARKGT